MVEIFKTNVQNDKEGDIIIAFLITLYPVYKINFDLDDEDNILELKPTDLKFKLAIS